MRASIAEEGGGFMFLAISIASGWTTVGVLGVMMGDGVSGEFRSYFSMGIDGL